MSNPKVGTVWIGQGVRYRVLAIANSHAGAYTDPMVVYTEYSCKRVYAMPVQQFIEFYNAIPVNQEPALKIDVRKLGVVTKKV